jgi:hypothetical protein
VQPWMNDLKEKQPWPSNIACLQFDCSFGLGNITWVAKFLESSAGAARIEESTVENGPGDLMYSRSLPLRSEVQIPPPMSENASREY